MKNPRGYDYNRQIAEPLCAANIKWWHQLNGTKDLVLVQQSSEINDCKHVDIIEVVGAKAYFHDVKTVEESTRREKWIDQNGNFTPDTSNYSVPVDEIEQIGKQEAYKQVRDKFFFEFEEYSLANPVVPSGAFYKVPFASILAYYIQFSDNIRDFLLVPLEVVRKFAICKYESMNSDIQ